MLSIIFAAALLPSVLGGCCHPDKYSGRLYSKTGGVHFVIDFVKGKYYTKPLNSTDGQQFTLVDFNTKEKYIQYNSGCVKSAATAKDLSSQCLPSNAVTLGSSYIGPKSAGVTTTGYGFGGGNVRFSMTVTNAQCLPVSIVVSDSTGAPLDTILFFGLDTSPADLAVLDADVSQCTVSNVVG